MTAAIITAGACLACALAWDVARRFLLVRSIEVASSRANHELLERVGKLEEGLRELRNNAAMRR